MSSERTSTRVAFGRALRSRRQELGLTAGEVGSALAVDASTISRMERGLVGVAVDEVPEIARVLSIAPRRLLAVITQGVSGGRKNDKAQAA